MPSRRFFTRDHECLASVVARAMLVIAVTRVGVEPTKSQRFELSVGGGPKVQRPAGEWRAEVAALR
jgi:hypothetical protein